VLKAFPADESSKKVVNEAVQLAVVGVAWLAIDAFLA
jgi:hypothetical protein